MLDDVTDNLPLGEKAYRTIKADVIFGRLTPGQRLTLDRMKEAYGTSVSTLREIFSRLSAEGFVVAEGSRGFQVMPISETNLREVAAMRQLLERHALRESFEALGYKGVKTYVQPAYEIRPIALQVRCKDNQQGV